MKLFYSAIFLLLLSAAGKVNAESVPVETLSSPMFEWRMAEAPDGNTAFLARGDAFFPVSRQAFIYKSTKQGEGWSTPVIASFSGKFSDMDPFVTPDGAFLYFCSIRPVAGVLKADMDIFRMVRTGSGWGVPERLGLTVNSGADELFVTLDSDGNLYFGSDREGGMGGWDIYVARPDGNGGFLPAENLGAPVNSGHWEFNPTIAPTGDRLFFTGLNLPGGAGFGDIYMSDRKDGVWQVPVPIESTNTAADEYHPSLTAAGDGLYFIRRSRTYPDGQIFQVPLR